MSSCTHPLKPDSSPSCLGRLIKNVIKGVCLSLYYGMAIHFPTQPMPGYSLGYALRRLLLKGIAESCGRGVIVKYQCYIGSGQGLKIGDRSQLGQNARIDQYVTIGNDVVMGPDIVIMTNAHEFEDPATPINQQGHLPISPVVIGNDVWLGTRVVILPGITIGNGAVIGAGSIVTKDIPPLAIAVGSPARVIRYRGEKSVSTTSAVKRTTLVTSGSSPNRGEGQT